MTLELLIALFEICTLLLVSFVLQIGAKMKVLDKDGDGQVLLACHALARGANVDSTADYRARNQGWTCADNEAAAIAGGSSGGREVVGVVVARNAPCMTFCRAFDTDHDGKISVEEVKVRHCSDCRLCSF